MPRTLITTGLLLGGLALAACGSAGPGVQARQTGDTTATTGPETTTTTAAPATTASPATTLPPATVAPAPPACTDEALGAAYAQKHGDPSALKAQKCEGGWATSSEGHGYGPPTFTLYRAEGDQWVVVNHSAGKLCEGQGVPPEVAPKIGCDS